MVLFCTSFVLDQFSWISFSLQVMGSYPLYATILLQPYAEEGVQSLCYTVPGLLVVSFGLIFGTLNDDILDISLLWYFSDWLDLRCSLPFWLALCWIGSLFVKIWRVAAMFLTQSLTPVTIKNRKLYQVCNELFMSILLLCLREASAMTVSTKKRIDWALRITSLLLSYLFPLDWFALQIISVLVLLEVIVPVLWATLDPPVMRQVADTTSTLTEVWSCRSQSDSTWILLLIFPKWVKLCVNVWLSVRSFVYFACPSTSACV